MPARKINPLLAINYTVLQEGAGEKIVTLTPQYVLLSPEGLIVDKKLPKPSDNEFAEKIAKLVKR